MDAAYTQRLLSLCRERKVEITMEGLQEGTGTLESKWGLKDKFDVSYSIIFQSGLIQPLPAAPNVLEVLKPFVNHIQCLDKREIPDGEYKLSYPTEGTQKHLYLRKYQDVWEVLILQSFQSW
jgi:hypothetical protein